MCKARRHSTQPAAGKAAGSYFSLRRGMADSSIERKALQFIPIPVETAP